MLKSILFVVFISLVESLYQDQADLYDWHVSLVGAFKHVVEVNPESKDKRIIVSTRKNVVASLETADGSIAWRHALHKPIKQISVTSQNVLTLLKDNNGCVLMQWRARSGFQKAQIQFPNTQECELIGSDKDGWLVRTDRSIIKYMNSNVVWEWKSVNQLIKAVKTENGVYITSPSAASGLAAVRIDLKTGQQTDEWTFDYETADFYSDLHNVALIGKLKGMKTVVKLSGDRKGQKSSIQKEFGETVLNVERLGSDSVLISGKNYRKIAFFYGNSFTLSSQPIEETASFTPGTSFVILFSPLETTIKVVEISTQRNKSPQSVEIPYSIKSYGPIDKVFLTQTHVIVTALDGTVYAFEIENALGRLAWERPEYLTLSSKDTVVFVDLPDSRMDSLDHDELKEPLSKTAERSLLNLYFKRVHVHLDSLMENTFRLLGQLSHVFSVNSFSVEDPQHIATALVQDKAGIRKLILFASETGVVVARDTLTNNPVWTRRLWLDSPTFKVKSLGLLRSSVVKYPPVVNVVVFTQEGTRVYLLNALDGTDFHQGLKSLESNAFRLSSGGSGLFLVGSAHSSVYVLDSQDPKTSLKHTLLLDEEFNGVVLPPISPNQNKIKYTVRIHSNQSEIVGYTLTLNHESVKADRKWIFPIPVNEKFVTFSSVKHVDVASLGRALGNRQVMYKYLNPNLMGFITIAETEESSTLYVYMLDTVSGSILHRARVDGAGIPSDTTVNDHQLQLLLCENWLVATYYNHGPDRMSVVDIPAPLEGKKLKKPHAKPTASPNYKGWELMVFELFEHADPDTRDTTDQFSSFQAPPPQVLSQAYSIPFVVGSIGVTETRQGITTKEIIVSLENDQLYAISKRILDPRRPYGSLSADDKEEGLIPYRPVLDLNPKEVISYSKQIMGTEHIITAPTVLESTSAVLTFGLDLFFTRRAPSKTFDVLSETFNYYALILTILGLFGAVTLTNQMVKQNQLKQYWK